METVIKSPVIADAFSLMGSVQSAFADRYPRVAEEDEFRADAIVPEPSLEVSIHDGHNNSVDEIKSQTVDSSAIGDSFEHLMDAHRETLEMLEQNAMKDGYAHGYSKGEADAQLKYGEVVSRFHELIDAGQESIATLLGRAEELIGAIVFEATCKIVGEQLLDRDQCLQVISHVIRDKLDGDILSIRLSPKDFEHLQTLKNSKDEADGAFSRLAALPIQADAAVGLGGCLVELKDGRIDGRIETQFRMFAQSIKDASGHR